MSLRVGTSCGEATSFFFFFSIINLLISFWTAHTGTQLYASISSGNEHKYRRSVSSVKARSMKQRDQPGESNPDITRGSTRMSLLADSAAEGSATEKVSEDNQNQQRNKSRYLSRSSWAATWGKKVTEETRREQHAEKIQRTKYSGQQVSEQRRRTEMRRISPLDIAPGGRGSPCGIVRLPEE